MKLSDIKSNQPYKVLSSSGVSSSAQSSSQPEQPKSFGQNVLDTASGVSNFFGGKGITDLVGGLYAKSQVAKAPMADYSKVTPEVASRLQAKGVPTTREGQIAETQSKIPLPSGKQVLGSALQLGANFIPGAGVGAKFGTKLALGLGTGYAMDVGSKLQQDQPVGDSLTPGIGTVVGGVLPVVGATAKYATQVMGRLFKGLGSGISGVSTKTLEDIMNNPEVAQQASDKLGKSGNYKVLEQNAKTLVNGVTKIQSEASSAYRKGLDKLSQTDIKPDALKKGFFDALQKNKIGVTPEGSIDFSNAQFLDPKIQQRAETLITKVNQQSDLSGTGVRKLMDFVDSAKFKSAPDGERQAFNQFAIDLKNGLKDGVNASTNKLSKINAKYSADMQLSEAAQQIFGNVNFKNVKEVATAAKKLEGLFNAKGLDPQTIDNYLTRIGVNPKNFKTIEAVRQISNKEPMPPNTPGFSIGEVARTVSGSVITPETIKNIAIKTGLAKEKLTPFITSLKGFSPSLQKVIIQSLLQNPQ